MLIPSRLAREAVVNAADRQTRDREILELFIGGCNYREIGAQVSLTIKSVEVIVKRELSAASKRRLLLQDQALEVHQERTERLFKLQYLKAQEGDQRAAEVCDRMLARNARLFGLAEEINPAPLPAPTSTAGVTSDDDEEPMNDLDRIRARRTAG